MEPQTIKIDEIEYVRKDSIAQPDIIGDVKIVILQRGWVMVGRLEEVSDTKLKLHNASSIRRWGTKQGLGEIAKNGPLANTILDKCNGIVEFHPVTVIATIACEESKWKPSL